MSKLKWVNFSTAVHISFSSTLHHKLSFEKPPLMFKESLYVNKSVLYLCFALTDMHWAVLNSQEGEVGEIPHFGQQQKKKFLVSLLGSIMR